MVLSQRDDNVEIVCVNGHYVGTVNGEFVISGDTWNEVRRDLVEMGYLK